MSFFLLALHLARRPFPALRGWGLGRVLFLLVPTCAAVGIGLAALQAAPAAMALALAMAVAALMAIPALADGLRGRAAAMRRYRQDASKAAAAAWLRAVRSLLPILAARWTAAAVAQRRAIVPRPPALAGRRVIAALTLTPRLLPVPFARRAVH